MDKIEALEIRRAVPRLLAEVRDWPVWWSELSGARRGAPAVAVALYWLALMALRGFRPDHVALGGLVLILYYGGRALDRLRVFAMPFLLTGILYDSQRFYADYIRGPIHVTQPYSFDKRFFGIHLADGRVLTPNEWWQLHTNPLLDLITGFAYLVFFAAYVVQCGYFHFWIGRNGTHELSPAQAREKARRMGWTFLWLNLAGYSTYYWYAASPPWYVARYGLGPARTDVPASSAGCVRFDQLLGTHFFSEMYGRAADVHGAIPSLHVAYPFLALIFALQFKRLRAFSACFYLLMCFSAVYLNHHYILDILWGSSYAVILALGLERYFEWRARARSAA
jgi:membrane-associated phospholipid phosphatase